VVQLYGLSWSGSYMLSVGCAGILCQLVVQVYGVSWLCSYMVSVGYAAIWFQLVVQVYGVSWLCRYMVSVGLQLYGFSWLCSYMVSVGLQLYGSCYYTAPSTLTQLQHSKHLCVRYLGEGGKSQQITSNCQQVLNWLTTNTCIS
jgi:hypothetical protein